MFKQAATSSLVSLIQGSRPSLSQAVLVVDHDDTEETFDGVWEKENKVQVTECTEAVFNRAWKKSQAAKIDTSRAAKSKFVPRSLKRQQVLTYVDTPANSITDALAGLDSGKLDGAQALNALIIAHSELNRLNGLSRESQHLSVAEACNRQRLQNLLLKYCARYAKRIRAFGGGRLISRYVQTHKQMLDHHLGDSVFWAEVKNPQIMCKL
jgi:hypothetical protein